MSYDTSSRKVLKISNIKTGNLKKLALCDDKKQAGATGIHSQ